MSRSLRDSGSASVESVLLTPIMLAFLLLAIYGGRVSLARQSVAAAASDAARTASIARSVTAASADAQARAAATLAGEGLDCISSQVSLDTSAFVAPVGTEAEVSATVTCTVDLSDLVVPGIPGRRALSATVTSPLDTYRERS